MVQYDNLAKKVLLYDGNGRIKQFTVSNSVQVSQGILMSLSDPNTATKTTGGVTGSGVGQLPNAGISAFEKEANDGATQHGLWTQGRFTAVASGVIAFGDGITFVADGFIKKASEFSTLASRGFVAGWALRTASDLERIPFELDL